MLSPEKRSLPILKLSCPAVWPGVCQTFSLRSPTWITSGKRYFLGSMMTARWCRWANNQDHHRGNEDVCKRAARSFHGRLASCKPPGNEAAVLAKGITRYGKIFTVSSKKCKLTFFF